jgi:hypothetical protein
MRINPQFDRYDGRPIVDIPLGEHFVLTGRTVPIAYPSKPMVLFDSAEWQKAMSMAEERGYVYKEYNGWWNQGPTSFQYRFTEQWYTIQKLLR